MKKIRKYIDGKEICDFLAFVLGIVLFSSALGGYEVGNYDVLSLLFRILIDAMIVLLFVYVGSFF